MYLRKAVACGKLAVELYRMNKIRNNERGSWLKVLRAVKAEHLRLSMIQIILHFVRTQHNAHFANNAVLSVRIQTGDHDVIYMWYNAPTMLPAGNK